MHNITTAALRAELLRRVAQPSFTRLMTPVAIKEHMEPFFAGVRREQFHVLCLDTRNHVLNQSLVAEGGVDQCNVDPREVFRPAILCRATGIVMVHNHPSGDPEPSVQDVALTRQLCTAGQSLCINVLDHIVMGRDGFVSMLARDLLPKQQRLLAVAEL